MDDPTARYWGLLADGVLVVHLGVAAFVVLGQVLIVVGGFGGVRWVRDVRFRLAHLALIVFIAGQTWLGQICPLTHLEQALRLRAGQPAYAESFTEHWLAPVIFFAAPQWVFVVAHGMAALVVVGSWFLVPPHWSASGALAPKFPERS